MWCIIAISSIMFHSKIVCFLVLCFVTLLFNCAYHFHDEKIYFCRLLLSKTRLTLSFARIITEQGIFLWQDSFIRMKHSLAAFESALPSRDYAKLSTGNGAGLRALNWTLLHKRGCSLFLSSFARNGNPDYGNYNVRRARRVTKAWRFFHAYDAPADLLKKRLKKDEESCDSNACLRTQWKLKIWKIWKSVYSWDLSCKIARFTYKQF